MFSGISAAFQQTPRQYLHLKTPRAGDQTPLQQQGKGSSSSTDLLNASTTPEPHGEGAFFYHLPHAAADAPGE